VTGLAERPGIAAPERLEVAKRLIDFAVSLSLLIAVAPLLLLLCVLVRATSKGPAVFRQERVGRDQRTFTLLKLRTMYTGNDDRIHRDYVAGMLAADQAGPQPDSGLYKLEADPRVTPVGGWLRRTSLDELPQLINVLRGEMSLVGPRPVLLWEARLFDEPFQRRFAVKPGITGLWQVNGRSKLSMRRALELDVEYVIRRSFVLDLAIILRTVPALFRGGAR
jgi:lipopolysaccharide/colanic/teichoic acid biosynthesis glycosyltransferase